MSRDADSPQAVWQEKLEQSATKTEYLIRPANFWWHNPTNHDSLRLTYAAYSAVKTSIKFYKFTLPEAIKPRAFVQLERIFKEPYYIQNYKTIHVTNERDSIMISLHANNLQQYLDNQSL